MVPQSLCISACTFVQLWIFKTKSSEWNCWNKGHTYLKSCSLLLSRVAERSVPFLLPSTVRESSTNAAHVSALPVWQMKRWKGLKCRVDETGLDGCWSEEVTGILVGAEGVTSPLNTHTGTPALFTPPAEVVTPVLCPVPSDHSQMASRSDPAWPKREPCTGAHPKVRNHRYDLAEPEGAGWKSWSCLTPRRETLEKRRSPLELMEELPSRR